MSLRSRRALLLHQRHFDLQRVARLLPLRGLRAAVEALLCNPEPVEARSCL